LLAHTCLMLAFARRSILWGPVEHHPPPLSSGPPRTVARQAHERHTQKKREISTAASHTSAPWRHWSDAALEEGRCSAVSTQHLRTCARAVDRVAGVNNWAVTFRCTRSCPARAPQQADGTGAVTRPIPDPAAATPPQRARRGRRAGRKQNYRTLARPPARSTWPSGQCRAGRSNRDTKGNSIFHEGAMSHGGQRAA
jgi:hypothetical protein